MQKDTINDTITKRKGSRDTEVFWNLFCTLLESLMILTFARVAVNIPIRILTGAEVTWTIINQAVGCRFNQYHLCNEQCILYEHNAHLHHDKAFRFVIRIKVMHEKAFDSHCI